MDMIGHQTIAVYLQTKRYLPFSEVRQVVLIAASFPKHGLAVVAALDDMMRKSGHNHPSLTGHLASPCLEESRHRIRPAPGGFVFWPIEKGLGASTAEFSRNLAWKIDLSRFSLCPGFP